MTDLTEAQIQKAVFQQLRARAKPGAVFWHVPNGPESRRKAGFLEGVHDVHIFYRKELFTIELKTPTGRPSEAQLRFRDNINEQGGFAFVSDGLDPAISALRLWGIIR